MNNRSDNFEKIYLNNGFKGKQSKSGPGSDLAMVETLICRLQQFFNIYEIKSITDAPCGDVAWVFETLKNTTMDYLGIDIVPKLIEDNKLNYPNVNFECKDLVETHYIGKADLMLCRDCLVHLSFESALKILKNFVNSDIKYLLTTTFNRDQNYSYVDGTGWYPIDLTKPPFNLPTPIQLINENCQEANGQYTDKSLGLWTKEQIKNVVS